MARRRLFWKLFPAYLLIILLCVVVLAAYAADLVWDAYHGQLQQELLAAAQLVEGQWSELGKQADAARLQALAEDCARRAGYRITVIGSDGKVLGDSESDPATMENHAYRTEVRQALADGVGVDVRYSATLKRDMKYVAVRHAVDGRTVGVVRAARPLESISVVLRRVYLHIAFAALMVALAAALLVWLVVHRISRLFRRMTEGARRFARGDLSRAIVAPETAETSALAEVLNHMAAELNDKLSTLTHQTAQQEAVLSSMAEGVLAVDPNGRILAINRSAADMLKTEGELTRGRTLEEVTRSVGLHRFVADVLAQGHPAENEILLPGDSDRTLQARASILRDAAGNSLGVLIVLNDLTRLNRLENMRRDFVANVSHELKTPVTSIKASVETLREIGFDDRAKAVEFLEILGRHADRLDALIDDLLALSRIERGTERREIVLTPTSLKDVLLAAIGDSRPRSTEQGVGVKLESPENIVLDLDPHLMEQAVHNLLDNAIKYSPSGSTVTVRTERAGDEVLIHVRDTGCGIAAEHLDRVFERFYRVDKARSRKLGGTGLGLAIVKHIAQAHGGRVTVQSTLGKGSTFTIHVAAR